METIKVIGTLNAQLLADYILQKYGPMSHLKLQKLLYYCESYHLAYFDTSLIPEQFEAWAHGPVCREVFNNLKGDSLLYADLGFNGGHNPERTIKSSLNNDQMQLLTDVLSELSTWTGLELETATHKEYPWNEARKGYAPGDRCAVKISKETMRNYYKAELNGGA